MNLRGDDLRWTLAAGGLLLLVYVAVLTIMPKQVFWSPDEGGKFLELLSIHWQGRVTYSVPYLGRRIDPARTFYPHQLAKDAGPFPYPVTDADGSVEFHWAMWFPLLSGVMLRTFGITGLYIIPLLSGWLIALASGWIAHLASPRLAPLAILLVGFATPICFYGQVFWEHTLATLLGLVTVAILLASRPGSLRALAFMLPLLGAATMLRLEMLVFAAATLLVWWIRAKVTRPRTSLHHDTGTTERVRRPRRLARQAAYVLAACLLIGMLNPLRKTLPARDRHFLTKLPVRAERLVYPPSRLARTVTSLVVDAGSAEALALDPTMITGIAVGLCCVAPFVASVWTEALLIIPALLVILGFSAWTAFLDPHYRSLHGIFPVAPFMVVWLYALADGWRRRDSTVFTLAAVALLHLIAGCSAIFLSYVDENGELSIGLEWGQRYLLTLYPLLAILSLVALQTYRASTRPALLKTTFTILVGALMIVGVQQEVRGLSMLRLNKGAFATWDRALRSDGPIVTDVWWLASVLTPLFVTKEMYFVQSRTELTEWLRVAATHATATFTYASLLPLEDDTLAPAGVRLTAQDSQTLEGLHITRFSLIPDAVPR